jgi:DNA-binding MltR family transcriptional regulator
MNVIKKMKEELEEKENQIRFLDTKTLLLEQELNIFKKMFEEKDSLVTKIALQPKTNTTTSTTTTMYNNLSVFDVEEITRRLNERMETVEYTDLLESGLLCEK